MGVLRDLFFATSSVLPPGTSRTTSPARLATAPFRAAHAVLLRVFDRIERTAAGLPSMEPTARRQQLAKAVAILNTLAPHMRDEEVVL